MLTHLHGERLTAWIAAAEQEALPGITRLATGLTADLAAVTAGLSLPFSSGPVEGNVNRIKMIKRQMYGRAGFDLLRKRSCLPHNDEPSRSVPAEPQVQVLTFQNHRREAADLLSGRLKDHTGRQPLQLFHQDGNLPLVEDSVKVGTEPSEHREIRAVEVDQLLSPVHTVHSVHSVHQDVPGLFSHL